MKFIKAALVAVTLFSSALIARAQESGQTGEASCPL